MQSDKLSKRRRFYSRLLQGVITGFAFLTVALVFALIAYILIRGVPHITGELLTTAPSVLRGTVGILPNILNTLYMVIITLVVVLPVGVGAAIYLTEYARNRRLVLLIEFATETLAGIPSIIYGLVGMLFFVQRLKLQTSLLAGALTLVIMILPTVVRTTQEALKTVPQSYREGAMALGSTRFHTIRTVVLPSSLDGIIAGAILGVGRILGESAALIFTAGIGAVVVTNIFSAMSRSAGTLSVALYVYVFERGEFDVGFAIASILVILVLLLNFLTRWVGQKLNNR